VVFSRSSFAVGALTFTAVPETAVADVATRQPSVFSNVTLVKLSQ
jgi:hypothetical protein